MIVSLLQQQKIGLLFSKYQNSSKKIVNPLAIHFISWKSLTDGKILKTCALRPAGIYGEGELRHLPRIVISLI